MIDWGRLKESLPGDFGTENETMGEFWGDNLGFGDTSAGSGGQGNFWTDLWGAGKDAWNKTMVRQPRMPRSTLGEMFSTPKTTPRYPSFYDDVMETMPEGFVPPEGSFYPNQSPPKAPYQGYGPMDKVMPPIGEFGASDPYEFSEPSRGMLAPSNRGPQGINPTPNRLGTGTGFGGY